MAFDALPAWSPEPTLASPSPGAWKPQPLPCPPTLLRLRQKGWEDTFRIPFWGQRNYVDRTGRPGASRPLPLAEAATGTCPFAHHGLPPEAPWRNRE